MPDLQQPFEIEVDTSKWATGAILRQKDESGKWHPCGFILHSFTPTERNYQVSDHELLAILHALEAWQHLILGSAHTTVVHSNHQNLTYFHAPQKLN